MKTTLTIEQSAELIKRGVSAERATRVPLCATSQDEPRWSEPIFTLADLLSLLPKEINRQTLGFWSLNIIADNFFWDVSYAYPTLDGGNDNLVLFEDRELIDTLYQLLLWAIDHNHVKLD